MIVITGWGSTIAAEVRRLLPAGETPIRGDSAEPDFPTDAGRYLFCQGLLRSKTSVEQTVAEMLESLRVNSVFVQRACDRVLSRNPKARICIIGSESAIRGSYDDVYASAKLRVHRYIETTQLRHAGQQLVGISPWIIEDSGMTRRRADVERLEERRQAHPKRRFLEAREVAEMAVFLLYNASDYVTGTVIRMHGGLK